MKYWGGLSILGISLAASVFCEFVSWLLIYRTSTYKSLMSSINKTTKKVESMKAGASSSAGVASGPSGPGAGSSSAKSKGKKFQKIKSHLRDANQNLATIKFQSGAVVALTLLIVFGLLNALFDGKTVAKLPFTPIPFFQKITHRNLPGSDFTDCSMVFFYMLCSLGIRPNLQKLLGFSAPRPQTTGDDAQSAAYSFFGIPTDSSSR